MRALLDTSVLIGDLPLPEEVEAAISVASITELHFGALVADDDDERARRTARLAVVEATFDPLPVSVEVARVWGQLAAAVARRGGNPRRQMDLVIAAVSVLAASWRPAQPVVGRRRRSLSSRHILICYMAVYEYRCRVCDLRFEARRPMSEAASPVECPAGHADTTRLLSVFATVGATGSRPAASTSAGPSEGCGPGCACAQGTSLYA